MNICSNPESRMLSADSARPNDSRSNPSAILKTKAGDSEHDRHLIFQDKAGDSELDRQMMPKDQAGDSESIRHRMRKTKASDPNVARNRVPPVTNDASGKAGHPMSGDKAGGAEPDRHGMPEVPASDLNAARYRVLSVTDDASGEAGHPMSGDKAGGAESDRHGMPEVPASAPNAARYRVPPVADGASGEAGHPMLGGKAEGSESNRYRMPETPDDDPAALAALVADYLPLVRRAARRMPEREQEDAIAEGQYQLIRAIKAYDPNTGLDLPGYLKIKIKYGMFNYFRRYRCEADRTVAEGDILTRVEALQAAQPDPMDGPAAQILRRLDEERLRAALDALSPGERACLEALYWMNMSHAETAEALEVSVRYVHVLRERALKKLKLKMAL